ncbi:hypothetical protein T05_4814 [Trichinella murrelli]|uniref:Uncharacterized protein n=1 Tax=Trichinella murrelli TaxID=144512 RepID=A0A0V0UCY0_9BILA|nr:hypothetical protein T05_4814 [Trichinella murrelli]
MVAHIIKKVHDSIKNEVIRMTRIWRYWDSRNSWDRFYKTCSVQHGAWHNSQHFFNFPVCGSTAEGSTLLALWSHFMVPPRPETAQYGNHVNESVEQPMSKMVEQPISV